MKASILFGPPGCGKTFAAEMRAKELAATLVEYQFHEWTDADELFVGVNVQAAVAGQSENVWQPGVLAVAAEKSQKGQVVLLLDELDKASERAEYLLLGFLQSGKVPTKPGQHLQASLDNIEVIITSNEIRPHSDALLRRCRRVFMSPIGDTKIKEILTANFHRLEEKTVAAIWAAAQEIAHYEGNNSLSVQEGKHLIEELLSATSYEQCKNAFAGWAARTREGYEYALGRAKKTSTAWAKISQ